MKSFLLIILGSVPLFADGPNFRHKDTFVQQEFEDVYQDLKKTRKEVSFLATLVAEPNITGDGTVRNVTFDTVVYNRGGSYDNNTTFTAPVSGDYSCAVYILTDGNTAGGGFSNGDLSLVTSNRTYTQRITSPSGVGAVNSDRVPYSVVVPSADMDAGDTASVTLTVSGGAKTVDIIGGVTMNWFGCTLINY